ncbi:extracellular solute-binding protein [Paenibacillus rhizoplanae]
MFVKQLRLESNEYYARLRTALSFGKGPDVAVIHADRLSPFIKAQQIIPLNALAEQGGFQFNQIGEQNLQSVSYAGQYYAVPLDTHFHMLYYNKKRSWPRLAYCLPPERRCWKRIRQRDSPACCGRLLRGYRVYSLWR